MHPDAILLSPNIHRYASRKAAKCHCTKNATHMSWTMLRGVFVDESAESVEEEILDHHLQDEDFGAVLLKSVANLNAVSIIQMNFNGESGTYRIYRPPLVEATEVPKQTAP